MRNAHALALTAPSPCTNKKISKALATKIFEFIQWRRLKKERDAPKKLKKKIEKCTFVIWMAF